MRKSEEVRRRAARWALLQTVADLRRAIAMGKPMTLPNCLRFCRRRLATGGRRDPAILDALLAVIPSRHQLAYRIILGTGLRRDELTEISQVDLRR